MNYTRKSLFSAEEMLERYRQEADKMLSGMGEEKELNLSKKEIKELLHQIQVQHIELEMQNDELKISKEEVENQQIKFAGLFNLAPVGYLILDKNGIITEVNNTACNLLDVLKRNLLSRRFRSFINPDEAQLFYTFLRTLFRSETQQSCQLTLITPKGRGLYVQIEGIAGQNPILRENECYITIVDITETRLAELTLKDTKERLEIALEASDAGTWQIDLKTEQISLDEFSCEIYGLKNCNSIQAIDTFIKMIHPEDRRNASKRFGEAISHKQDLDVEYRIIKPDKSIAYISARGHVIENESAAICFVGILLDITERKRLETEALRLKEEHQKTIMTTVFRTQENERKRISEALHDSVSQLLYGIKLKLQDYKRCNKDENIYEELNSLIEQAVEETRDISFELAPSILSDFGLPIALEEMAKRLNTEKLKISTKVSGLKERLDLNKEINIFRIVQELVNNVIKHANATELKIALIKKNNNLNISVSDNGEGFDSMHTLNASGSGLHSIKNRLDLFNGTMSIQSTKAAGTVVHITFKDVAS